MPPKLRISAGEIYWTICLELAEDHFGLSVM